MLVTDDQVAALRAYLTQDLDEADRLSTRLGEHDGWQGYGELIWAAFVLAVRKQFAPEWAVPQVIRYVAAVRTRWGQDANDIDPRTAEILMRRALDDRVDANLNELASSRAQLFLLNELIVDDQELLEHGLDELLASARTLANRWLSAR